MTVLKKYISEVKANTSFCSWSCFLLQDHGVFVWTMLLTSDSGIIAKFGNAFTVCSKCCLCHKIHVRHARCRFIIKNNKVIACWLVFLLYQRYFEKLCPSYESQWSPKLLLFKQIIIFRNILLFVPQNKVKQDWNDIRLST